jgi:hypothetical protein
VRYAIRVLNNDNRRDYEKQKCTDAQAANHHFLLLFLLAFNPLLECRGLLLVLKKDDQVACRCILVVGKLGAGKILLLRVGELASGQVGLAVELVDLVPVGVQRRVADCCVVAGLDHRFRKGLTTGITG